MMWRGNEDADQEREKNKKNKTESKGETREVEETTELSICNKSTKRLC